MNSSKAALKPIDDYIARFPEDVQERLKKMRATIRAAAPKAEEAIKYQLPTFVLHGNLVHFGAFKDHIGFYALPSAHAKFSAELAKYKGAKGSVQFPYSQPLPLELVKRIVRFRAKENLEKTRVAKPMKRKAVSATIPVPGY